MYFYKFFLLFSCISSFFLFSNAGSLKSESIVNGDLDLNTKYPYHVSVEARSARRDCGGTIIGSQYVLTAAHCVANMTTGKALPGIVVVAGTNDLENPAIERCVSKVFLTKRFVELSPYHNRIQWLTDDDDIAVLKLQKKFKLKNTDYTSKVKLPAADNLYEKAQATIVGYGIDKLEYLETKNETSYLKKSRSKKLRVVKNEVQKWTVCTDYYKMYVMNKKNYICAKTLDSGDTFHTVKNVCQGDSGGGLIVDKTIIGVLVNVDIDCLKPLSIYMRVSAYRDFIDKSMNETPDSNIISESFETESGICSLM